MNKELQRYLEKIIRSEHVSVHHDYDAMESNYTIPYNAALASDNIKLMLLRADGILDEDEELDEYESIDFLAESLTELLTPEFGLSTSHYINNRNKIMTKYTLDFDGTILHQKTYPSEAINTRSPLFRLIKMCSDKIIAQEHIAQKHKMEKTFISMNMFKLYAQHGKK